MTYSVTLADLVSVTGYSRQTLWRLRRNRLLPFENVGGTKHFKLADVIAALRAHGGNLKRYETELCSISKQRLAAKSIQDPNS